MTMQNRPHNPIERRKAAVRQYTRNGVISVAAGVGGGVLMTLISGGGLMWLILGLVVAVVGGVHYYRKVQNIINHKDNY